MEKTGVFEGQADYEVPLLRLLAALPGGQGRPAEVCRLFEAEHGHRIPDSHRGSYPSNPEPIWRNNLRWCRAILKERGFLDPSLKGMWRITDAGRRWVEQNPGKERIPGSASTLVRARRPTPTPRSSPRAGTSAVRSSGKPPAPGITLEMLEQTRKTMRPEEFQQVWGALYDQLRAHDRAKAVSEVTHTELGRRARRHLDVIHGLLQGQNVGSPSAEAVCDWIHFCYAMELYREAAALLPYVHEEEVDPAVYRRAKRIAEVCRNKEG